MRSDLTGVHHFAVSVPDLAIARRFYLDLLGAEEVSAVEWPAGVAFIEEILDLPDCAGRQFLARLGNLYVEVFEFASPAPAPQEGDPPVNRLGYTHFALQVPDIDTVYDRMVAAGLRFHCPPKHSGEAERDADGALGFRSTYGRDYFGNVFELIEINRASAIGPL